jgi:hypothetical protein
MPAEAIGRARMKSTRAGSREEERRPLSLLSNRRASSQGGQPGGGAAGALELVLQAPSGEQPDPMGRWIATGALAE